MKPPSNVYSQVARDRAAAGRLRHVRAAVSQPGSRPLSPDDLRRARAESGRRVAAAYLARRAAATPRPEPPPQPLDEVQVDVATRELQRRRPELSYPEARMLVQQYAPTVPGARPDGGPPSTRRVTVLPLPRREPLPPAKNYALAPSNVAKV